MEKRPPSNLIHILDLFENVYSVTWKRMFGGFGIFHRGLMVAIVVKNILYLKSSEENRTIFEEKKLERFSYQSKGKTVYLKYYMAPEIIFDDTEEAEYWLNLAIK